MGHRTCYQLALLALGAAASACALEKEPLRAGWLASGVYAYPPVAKCAPPRPPGVPYTDLSRWTLPPASASGSIQVSLPWLGTTPVTAQVRAAGATGPRTHISQRAPAPMTVVEERAASAQVPGFAAGIDLRRYRSIAFLADTSGWMCDYARCNGEEISNLPAPLLQIMGDQIDAAVAGLRPDQRFVVYAGSAWRELRYAPVSPGGRALAGEFVRGQVCTGARGFLNQFGRAVRENVDAIVLFTSGALQPHDAPDYERMYTNCGVASTYLYCYVDDRNEAVNVAGLAGGARVPPVIAVTLQRHDARWLQNLAEATGGAYVDIAP